MLQNISQALSVAETFNQPPLESCKFSTRDARRAWIPMQWSHASRIGERGHPRGFQDSGEQRRSPNFKLVFSSFSPAERRFLLYINIIRAKTSNGILQLVPEP
jgi:hypothetical protein